MKVICISGKAGHGKDTAARCLKEQLELGENRVLITHFGDLVKYICKTFLGWDGEKNEGGRLMLQTVGTDIVRSESPDFWVNFIADILNFFKFEWDYVIIPDLRFENELKTMIKRGFDVYHIRVVRDDYMSELTDEQQMHESETSMDDYLPDIYVQNPGNLADFCGNLLVALDELKL